MSWKMVLKMTKAAGGAGGDDQGGEPAGDGSVEGDVADAAEEFST